MTNCTWRLLVLISLLFYQIKHIWKRLSTGRYAGLAITKNQEEFTAKANKARKGEEAVRLSSCFAGFPFYDSGISNRTIPDAPSVAFSFLSSFARLPRLCGEISSIFGSPA
jgi:hypothetical protein